MADGDCGNDQQCLAATIWKYRSGFGDHRFTFFIDLLPNYTFYSNLTNIVHWIVVYRDVAHLITLNLGKVEKKYAKSFDAGLTHLGRDKMDAISQATFSNAFYYPRPVLAFGYCRWLRLSVCVCGKHLLVRAITCHAFKLESPNLDNKSKTPWLRSLLFWGGNWPWTSRSNLT